MELDESLLDVASISASSAKVLGVENWDILQLQLCLPSLPLIYYPSELTTCIVQAVVQSEGNVSDNAPQPKLLRMAIHPVLYEYLCTSYETLSANQQEEEEEGDVIIESSEGSRLGNAMPVSVAPLPIPWASISARKYPLVNSSGSLHWKVKRVETIRELPPKSSVSLSCLYLDDKLREFCQISSDFISKLKWVLTCSLGGRLIMTGTTAVLHTFNGMAVVVVSAIGESDSSSQEQEMNGDIAYRVGEDGTYHLEVTCDESVTKCGDETWNMTNSNPAKTITWELECPGYEKLVQELLQLLLIKGPAAPSGVVLTGSPQVGKSHLASCVAYKLTSTGLVEVHWISVQELLMHATWADEDDIVKLLRPPQPATSDSAQLLVIDDLHILGTEDSTQDAIQANVDAEMLVVQNSILRIIDELQNENIAILGISQTSSNLPNGFVRIGRLEKEVVMPPPTQSQREAILRYLIPRASADNGSPEASSKKERVALRWAEALSPVTVGCVAGDLCRLLAAAWTKSTARGWELEKETFSPDLQWEDLQEVTRTYVPMQLLDVDVSKPQSFLAETSISDQEEDSAVRPDDWAKIHELSWKSFGGYANEKKRLLRTVVGPWKRFLISLDDDDDENNNYSSMRLSPPPGVLFHGPSGNGKSFAATCLGSSLGLPMIKVRASDVMDKWLGGSEAILRSLFTRARAAAPCILMFDEIDAVASNRASGDEGGSEVMSRLLSTLLNEMDGISSDKQRSNVLVVACTNRLDDLDAALLRPGRLEEQIHLKDPEVTDVIEILKVHLANVPMAEDIDLSNLANDLAARGASGADIEGICRETCFLALDRANSSKIVIQQEDFHNALSNSRL